MDIGRFLPTDQYDAAVDANAPSSANPFATIADLENWAIADLVLSGNRVHDFDNNSITEDNVAEYDTNVDTAGNRKIFWDNGAGVTIINGVGANPAGFTGGGAATTYLNTPAGTKAWGGVWNNLGNAQITYSVYDPAFATDEAGFIAESSISGGNFTQASIYHLEYASGDQTGFQANVFGERLLSQSTGLNRLSAVNAPAGVAFISGVGATGYIQPADQDGLVDWMDNSFGVSGWGGIYNGSGIVPLATVATLSGNLIFQDGVNSLLQIGGATAVIVNDAQTNSGDFVWRSNASATGVIMDAANGNVIINGVTGLGSGLTHYAIGGFGAVFQGSTTNASSYTVQMRNSAGTTIALFRDSGRVDLANNGAQTYMGAMGTNYALQSVQEFLQFSSTAAFTGFHANRDGTQIAMRATSANGTSYISSTGRLGIHRGWNGNFPSGFVDVQNILIQENDFVAINAATALTAVPSRFTVFDGDAEITGSSNGLILESPDSTRWRIQIDNAGSLTFTSLP